MQTEVRQAPEVVCQAISRCTVVALTMQSSELKKTDKHLAAVRRQQIGHETAIFDTNEFRQRRRFLHEHRLVCSLEVRRRSWGAGRATDVRRGVTDMTQ